MLKREKKSNSKPLLKVEEKSAEKLIIPTDPDQLTNDHIQRIGQSYINSYGEKKPKWYSFHKSQSFAKMLREYDVQNEVDDKWEFLANTYKTLLGHDSEISVTIRTFFESAFKVKIKTEVKASKYEDKELSMEEVSDKLFHVINHYYKQSYKSKYLELSQANVNEKTMS